MNYTCKKYEPIVKVYAKKHKNYYSLNIQTVCDIYKFGINHHCHECDILNKDFGIKLIKHNDDYIFGISEHDDDIDISYKNKAFDVLELSSRSLKK